MTTASMNALIPLGSNGSLALQPAAVGNLDAYISAVNRIALLTADEESRLAREFRDHADLDSARHLVLSHLRLVVAVARGYLGYG